MARAVPPESELQRPQAALASLIFLAGFAFIVFLAHSPFFNLPYFWDELGQFVPAALDLYHDGVWVPHSAVPNVHPPGVMAWLAAAWKIAGYSIPATRAAMLALSAFGVLSTFLLAIRLCRGLSGAPAFVAVMFLLVDPLFYTQSMMAQLDMPAMVFTVLGLWLFLEQRHAAAALTCCALVLSKETGALLPALCLCSLLTHRGRERYAAFYIAPFVVLTAWLVLLWQTTGHPLGDPGFAHYNVEYALDPVRAAGSLLRHAYYVLIADFRWVGSVAIVIGWKRGLFRRPGWHFTILFAALHLVLVSVLGGAELERYLLPILPIFYVASTAAMTYYRTFWRNASAAALALGLLAGLVINPPYPFPYENNLAMTDFVELHRQAARFVEQFYGNQVIYTAWPLTAAMRRPEYGYVDRGLSTKETSDLRYSTLSRLDPKSVRVLVLYSRTWEPTWGALRLRPVRDFLTRFYQYEPQLDAKQCRDILGLQRVARWTQRGQWIEVYAKPAAARAAK